MPDLRSQHGQATIDYVALIAALALLIAGAGALATGGAPGVANAVLSQLRRALCIVAGGACTVEPRRPCVVAGERETRHIAISIAIVRADEDRIVLRERMSDGTVRLTVAQRSGAGVEAGIGARLRLTRNGRSIGLGREARGAAQAVAGHGTVYVARDEREADEIERAVTGRGLRTGRRAPRPREVFVEGGARVLGRLGLGGPAAGISLEGTADAILGARRDTHSGDVTVSLAAGRSGWALLSAVLAGPSDAVDGNVAFGLTLDRHRRPSELTLSSSGTLVGGATLPAGLARALGVAEDDASIRMAGRRWELVARADLRDRDVAAAWAAFRDDPTSTAAIAALGARLRDEAHLDARSYTVRSDSDGVAGGLSLGLRLGGELDRMTDRSQLLSAATRPPGGLWEPRTDCMAS